MSLPKPHGQQRHSQIQKGAKEPGMDLQPQVHGSERSNHSLSPSVASVVHPQEASFTLPLNPLSVTFRQERDLTTKQETGTGFKDAREGR